MPLIPSEPFRQLDQWRRDLSQFFDDVPQWLKWQNFGAQRMDVYDTPSEVVVSCEIPGLENKEDLNIDIDGNMLTISGTVNQSNEFKEEEIYRKERFSGRFQRTVTLPAHVQPEGTRATYKNGILEIRMPKVQNEQRRRIDIEFH